MTNEPHIGRRRVLDLTGVTLRGPRPPAVMKRTELYKAIEALKEGADIFHHYDVAGVPEEWLPQFCVRLDRVLGALVDFQREVNAVVARDSYFAAVRQREDLEGVELHEELAGGAVLEHGLSLSEWAPVEAVAVVRRVIQALGDAEVDLGDGEAVGEDELGSTVVQGDVAHGPESTGLQRREELQ